MNIPITKTYFSESDFQNLIKPLQSGWIVQGPFVKEFEQKWSAFTGSEYSIAVSNCTTALTVSLYAAGIGQGDEVIVPSFTWIATANAVETLGAKPVFCDIDISSYNIDVNQIERLITPRTKAIIPVHLFGLAAQMDSVMEIAKKYKLFVIEDAACGFAGSYKGKHVGLFGDTGCFSFHPRKAITTGEGGMVTVQNSELDAKIRSLRDHGALISDLQRHYGTKPYLLPDFPYAGFNFRMTDIQASIGCSQMDRAEEICTKRMAVAGKYDILLRKYDWLKPTVFGQDYVHGYQSYVCLFSPKQITLGNVTEIHEMRNKFMDFLQINGISTRPGTHAVHLLHYYSGKYKIKPEDFPGAYIADKCSIALPLYPGMTEDEFNYVSNNIEQFHHQINKV